MVAKDFHGKPFDSETRLKLAIFQGYIRNWLPVFLSRLSYRRVCIYDFFAGPGYDSNNTAGSPIIIRKEIDQYLGNERLPKATEIEILLYFNDNNKANYQQLLDEVEGWGSNLPYKVQVENKDFADAFRLELPFISDCNSANLVILDQFGIKHITEEVFQQLIACSTTDIIFFISSNTIKRFFAEESIRRYIPLNEEEIKSVSVKEIHRLICNEYYRKLIPNGIEYYLAPFSIKKEDGNIYGLIFGSGKLLGLQKFLEVCWEQDNVAGEANYAIDDDEALHKGQIALFEEYTVFKKTDEFTRDLIEKLREHPDNRELYRFCLENGFLPKHIVAILTELRKDDKIEVKRPSGELVSGHAYYINWDNFKLKEPRAIYSLKGDM